MLPYRLDFDSPWYLLLLALLPVMWWFGRRSLSGLGRVRKWVVLLLRSAVFTLIVLSLAEIQWVKTNDQLTVIYLLDQSLSIPQERREKMIEFVNESIRQHRKNLDRVGVIVFGREAVIEVPPFDESVQLPKQVETPLDPESTNLAGALKLAQATFPEDAAKRIVIVSDGNQNMGDALDQARHVADAGVGIDVQPVVFTSRSEVLVEKVTLPPDVRKGQPFDLRVVLNNTTQPAEGESGLIKGKLIVSQRTDDQPQVIAEEAIELPGKHVYTIRRQLDQPHFYTYEARFVPDNPADDAMVENNRATTFTHVRGSGQVLLIEDMANRGEHEFLIDRLRHENLEVTVHASDQLFNGLAELQQFDTVVLANVPREDFTDQQIVMLAQNTQSMGCGLVMLGGPNSFGAGGWNNTAVEEAMPVDFQIKSAKVVPKGALALVMHASEMADGNHWQKVIAKEAIKALGNEDYCGLLPGTDQWLWGGMIRVGGSRPRMLALIDRMTPMDMPDFDSGLKRAHRAMSALTDAAVKHMIIISDGDPTPPSNSVLNSLKKLKVTVSSVAVGAHGPAESAVMKDIARKTGGKYYEVLNPNALPRIFQREARRVARPLVYEKDAGFSPYVRFPHEMVSGVTGPLPPITGFVQTTVKKNPLVEVSLVSPEPAGEDNATILASWTYGLGKTVAFTSDAGARWTSRWTKWEGYDKLFSQMVRWSMRPAGDLGKFTIATDVEQGQVKVFVTALDKDDEFLNFLDLGGAVIGPDMKPHDVQLEQTAPGRYVGSFQADDAGSYFVMLSPGAGQTPLLTGVNVPYSPEFRDRQTNEALLNSLARLEPKGGPPGMVIEDPTGRAEPKDLAAADTFRHDLPKASSRQDVWHYALLIAGLTFFGDVFFRRVQVSFAWAPALAGRLRDRVLGRAPPPPSTEYISRLRSRKAEVSEQLEQRRAAARFEPTADKPADIGALEEQIAAPTAPPQRPGSRAGMSPEAQEEETYTSRLLKVKKDVRKRTDQQ